MRVNRTVDALVHYGYTGEITISWENVERIYLLAFNLKCTVVMEWCADFLESR